MLFFYFKLMTEPLLHISSNASTAVECGFPNTVENGGITGIDFTYPHTVHFVCNQGYRLVGNDSTTCQASGDWSAESPTCVGMSLSGVTG